MDSLRNVKAVILHLSDIHRTPDEAVTNAQILNGLIAALDDWIDAKRAPDIVVVSGDITQGAEPQEYDEARAFLEGLLNHLKLDRTRLVLVPGNHDVYWPESEEALRTSMHMPTHCDHELISKMDEVFFYPKSEEAYQKRLDNFRTFYKSLIGTEYPRDRPKQVTTHIFDNFGLAFAGFNSCDVVDHIRFRPSIHSTAIYEASEALNTIIGTCIAVWHHDLDWRNEGHQDTLKHDCLQQISQRVFRLALCGHMHKPGGQNVQTLGGNPLPVITAGSLCAGPRQRTESVPRQFNIIEVDVDTARVHTRVKDEKSSPWRMDARYSSGDACVPWFDVTLPRKRKNVKPIGASRTTTDVNVKTPTPFGESMASKMPREEVVLQYVWNEYADAFDCSIPQIVLGPRGSGKTALLLSLTFQGRKSSSRYREDPTGVLTRLGLMCPMKITDASAFLNKGWLSKDERRKMFAALISSLWAKELTDTLELAIPWAKTYNLTVPSQEEAAYNLGNIWFNTKDCKTYEDVRERLREIRGEMRAALSEIDDSQRESILRRIGNYPIYHGGLEVLSAVANILKRYHVFSNTNWFVLFDEVEYLDDWQQDIVYQCLAVAAEGINVKIATLPYSHIHALDRVHPGITEYDDYQELVLALPAQVAGGEAARNQGTKLVEIARGIWNNRLHAAGLVSAPLETVWPEEEYTAVLATAGASELSSTKALEEGMIDDLPESSRERIRDRTRVRRSIG